MDVKLTPEQAEQLAPLFKAVRAADALSLTGMLVAQVWDDKQLGYAWMRVGFVKHHQAKQLVHQATAPERDSEPASALNGKGD